MLKVTRGIVKAKGKYYHKGDTVKGLTKAQEKALLDSGLVVEIYEKSPKQSLPPDKEPDKKDKVDNDPGEDDKEPDEAKVPPLES